MSKRKSQIVKENIKYQIDISDRSWIGKTAWLVQINDAVIRPINVQPAYNSFGIPPDPNKPPIVQKRYTASVSVSV